MNVQSMLLDHIEQCERIEGQVSYSPWSAQQFADSIRQHNAYVAENDGNVIGFAVVATVFEQAEILNIAIHPDWQGGGYGKHLLKVVISHLPESVTELFLEVRVTNFRAIHLYQSIGFQQVGVRKDYYPCLSGREDALVMMVSLPLH